MSVKDDIVELKKLDAEIRRVGAQLKRLKTHRKKCESRILEYLDANGHPGVTYNDITIVAKPIKKRHYVPKKERLRKAHDFLNHLDGPPTQSELEKFFEYIKGECDTQSTIRIY